MIAGGLVVAGGSKIESGPLAGCDPALMLVLSNAVMFLYSANPMRERSPPNDVQLLWQTWRRPKKENEQMPAFWYQMESEECQRNGRHEEASRWIEAGLKLFPDNYWLEYSRASNLIDLKQYIEARRALARLLGRYGRHENMRVGLFNNIAWAGVLSQNPALLDEANICSKLAWEQAPWDAYRRGTRGSVLVEIGEIEEGLKLLHLALKQHTERRSRALVACYVAIGENRSGRSEVGRSYFALARRLDPHCTLLERENP